MHRFAKERKDKASPEGKKEEAGAGSPEKSQKSEQEEEKRPTGGKSRKLLRPGTIFGELTVIMQKKWRHVTIFALEDASVISFSNSQISRIVKVPSLLQSAIGAELEG